MSQMFGLLHVLAMHASQGSSGKCFVGPRLMAPADTGNNRNRMRMKEALIAQTEETA